MKIKLLLILCLLSIGVNAQTWINGGNGIQYSDAGEFRSYRQILTYPQKPYGITDSLSKRADLRKANTFVGNNIFQGDLTSTSRIDANSIASSNSITIGGINQSNLNGYIINTSGLTKYVSGSPTLANNWPSTAGVIATIPDINSNLALYQLKSERGQSNGYASLDVNGNVPLGQINASLLGAVNYQGIYNATTNTPALATPAAGNKGWYYIVSASGTQVGLNLSLNDWVISNGVAWGKVDNNNSVTSVAGKTGVVTLVKGDVGLGNVDNTSDANKPVSNATAALLTNYVDRSSAQTIGGVKTFTSDVLMNSNLTAKGLNVATNGKTSLITASVQNGSNPYSSGAVILSANSTSGGTDYNTTLSLDGTQAANNAFFLPPSRVSDGILAQKGDFATGKTIGANTTGNAATSTSTTQWKGNDYGVTPLGGLDGIMAYGTGNYNLATLAQVRTFLGSPSGGETLQSVTARGAVTPNTIFISGINNPAGLPTGRATYMQQNPSGAGTIESYNFNTSTANTLSINPNGGNVGIGTTTPGAALEVNGNAIVATPTASNHATTKAYVDGRPSPLEQGISVGSNYSFFASDFNASRIMNLFVTASGSTITITLPDAASWPGYTVNVIVVAGGNTVTVKGFETQNINASNTDVLGATSYTTAIYKSSGIQVYKLK